MMDIPRFYYADGYHGGTRGHMPLGCWRDILRMLEDYPQWKLSLDVEPISWDDLKARDPVAYGQLWEMLKDQSIQARLEMVAGNYGQPYGWTVDGESCIRHLELGLRKIHEHFPWIQVQTYAVQEPCWTSALPQILNSFGFQRAVLKNPSTAWGGYCAGVDAEVCFWEGPDGTRIPTVPRYACEDLLNTWETESVNGEVSFVCKSVNHGIDHPSGMYYQDLGWPSLPRLSDKPDYPGTFGPDYVTYTTWKEYMQAIAKAPELVWRVSQEDFRVALPWGERVLVRMARQVRRGEAQMLRSERLQALASIICGTQVSHERLREAWEHLLMTQHHDGWICAAMGQGEDHWGWKASAQIYALNSLTKTMDRQALEALAARRITGEGESICVISPLGRRETRLIQVPFTSTFGTESVRVFEGARELVSQYVPERTFPDGSKNAGMLLFMAELPGFGMKSFRVQSSKNPDRAECPMGWIENHKAWLETNRYIIGFDLSRGGTIFTLFDKKQGKEVVDNQNEKRFNEYSGFFVHEGRFLSSSDAPAEAEILECGPIRAAIQISGSIGQTTFTQRIYVANDVDRITVAVTFHFPEKTYIGDPHTITEAEKFTDRHRSYHDGRYKLNAWFPTVFSQKKLYKDAAFDVCESHQADTYFKRWDEIKHNILVGWVDVSDGQQGLGVFSDHTTSYIHGPDLPLGLTLAWGGDGGYWWGHRQLKGEHSLSYDIVPHAGDWLHADLWHSYQKRLHPPIPQRVTGHSVGAVNELVRVEAPVELTAAYMDEQGRLVVRLFAPGRPACAQMELDACFDYAEQISCNGELLQKLPLKDMERKRGLRIQMPGGGIRTLRFGFLEK